jgi:hypothetical protein
MISFYLSLAMGSQSSSIVKDIVEGKNLYPRGQDIKQIQDDVYSLDHRIIELLQQILPPSYGSQQFLCTNCQEITKNPERSSPGNSQEPSLDPRPEPLEVQGERRSTLSIPLGKDKDDKAKKQSIPSVRPGKDRNVEAKLQSNLPLPPGKGNNDKEKPTKPSKRKHCGPAAKSPEQKRTKPSPELLVEFEAAEIGIPISIQDKFKLWQQDHCNFFKEEGMTEAPTSLSSLYNLTKKTESAKNANEIRFRFFSVAFVKIKNLFQCSLSELISMVEIENVNRPDLSRWLLYGRKLLRLAEELGGTGCFFVLPPGK